MSEELKNTITESGDQPNIGALLEEYDRATTDDNQVDDRLRALEAVRYSRWAGQTADCVQHEEAYASAGREALYEGAADTKVMLVDDLINDVVDLLVGAFNGAQSKTSPVTMKSMSAAQSGELFTVLNWLKEGPLKKAMADNVEISAQFTAMVGWCVLFPSWQKQKLTLLKTIRTEDVRQLAAQARAAALQASQITGQPPSENQNLLAALPELLADPDSEDVCVELFRTFFPDIGKGAARKHVKQLREQGETQFPQTVETNIGPKIDVYCPWYHFFLPVEATARPTDARVKFIRVQIPPWRVNELAEQGEWAAGFADRANATAGQAQRPPETKETDRDLNNNLVEIVYAFRTVFEGGTRKNFCTVLCPQIRPGVKDEADCMGANWEMNMVSDDLFVYPRLEATDWCITDTRGVPDTTATNQAEMKNFRDATYNYTQLSVSPPMQRVGTAASAVSPAFGPFAVIENPLGKQMWQPLELVKNANIEVPFKLQELLRKEAEDRYGMERGDTVPARSVRRQQKFVSRFLAAWGEALMMSVVQAYQNMGDELQELLGHAPLLDAETIVKHLLLMSYDVRTGDPVFLERIEKTITAILGAGLGNDLMLNKVVAWWLSLVDPNAAQEFIPQDQAPQRQAFKDARDELNNVMMGNKPMLVEKDPAAQQKLQAVQQLVQENPTYQQMLKQNPEIAANFKTMTDNWQHSVQELVISKAQGRFGVKQV